MEFEYFKISYDEIAITKYNGTDSIVNIPNNIDFRKVVAIADNCFLDNKKIKKVILPPSCKIIRNNAFKNCVNLKEIELNEDLLDICDNCFFNCTKLSKVIMPDTIETIGKLAFYNCINLKEIYFSKKLKSIGSWAFDTCKSLKKINIDVKNLIIKDSAFMGCISLEKVYINELHCLDDYAFCNCTSLKEVTFYCDQNVIFGFDIFANCKDVIVNYSLPMSPLRNKLFHEKDNVILMDMDEYDIID